MAEIKVRAERQTGDEIAQQIAEIVLDAHVKLGEMLEKIERKYISPTVGSGKGTDGNIPKQQKTLPPGIDKKQSHKAQRLFNL